MWRLLLLVLLVTAACSGTADPGPRFDDGGQRDVACMQHQGLAPGARYTDPNQRRTDETLPLLRYYTANGLKPYCDKAGPSDVDRAWAKLYVDLGADRENVANLVG
jgi:hypothetical protein